MMAGTLGEILGVMMAESGMAVAGLVQGMAGTAITQASLSAITFAVNRYSAAGIATQTGAGALVIADVVFDTAQTGDPRYTLSGGYNFLAVIPASCFLVAGLLHRIRVKFTPVAGEAFTQTWKGTPL